MLLKVRVTPRSKSAEIKEIGKGRLRVRVISPPVDARANKELIEILARYYNKPKSAIQIVKGSRSREKLVSVNE